MTEATASLIIKVDSTGAKSATGDLDKLTAASGRAEGKVGVLTGAYKAFMAVAASAAVAKTVGMYIRMADAASDMSAKLKLVTGSLEGVNKAQRDLFSLSQSTSADLQATTDLYVKLGQSSEALAGNHELLLGITEKVSKALVISGADAASSAAVIRQFSQAMGAGALRGDEFISVMEGAPRLARAIADGMGVAVGSLRTLAAEGKLTSETIIKALENQGAVLDREFGEMPLTVSRATQQVRNALLKLVGDTDTAEGATRDLADAVAGLARTLESDETKQGLATLVSGLVQISEVGAGAIGVVTELGAKVRESAQYWEGFMRWASGTAGNNSGLFGVGDMLREKAPWLYGLPSKGATAGATAPTYHPGIDSSLPAPLPGDPSGKSNTVSGDLQKELDRIKEQAAAYGLSRVELAKLNQERALAAATNDAEREAIRAAHGELIKRIQADEGAKKSADERRKAQEEEKRAADTLARAYDAYNARLHEGIELHGQIGHAAKLNYELQHGALKGLEGGLAAILREQAEWQDWLDDMTALEGVWADAAQERTDRMIDGWGKAGDQLSEFAKQAARNIQDTLADFIFDPFEDGVSGMVRKFSEALRRMTAEVAASELLKAVGQWGNDNKGASGWMGALAGMASSLYGGQKAAGGPVMAGKSYTVLDGSGPEIFTPNTNGVITPLSSASRANTPPIVNVTINKGASEDRTEVRPSGNGGLDIEIWLRDAMRGQVASGALDGPMGARYGMKARGSSYG